MVKRPSQSSPDSAVSDLSENESTSLRSRRDKKSNAATGVSAAGVRAVGSQALAFYFRAPAKAFFRTRVDYLVRENTDDRSCAPRQR